MDWKEGMTPSRQQIQVVAKNAAILKDGTVATTPLLATEREIDHRTIDKGIRSRVRLAELTGIKADTLGNLWKGSREAPMFVHDAAKIANVLDCKVEELLGEESEPVEQNRPDPLDGRPVLREVMEELSDLTESQLTQIRGVISAAANMPNRGQQRGDAEAS